jgi:prephenate dehydratase
MKKKPAKEIIAFQGEPGAFSQIAIRQFLPDADILPCERFEQVYIALRDGQATGAAIPMENTLHGSVHENYDHLLNFDVRIVAETSVRIVHNLIVVPGVKFSDIRQVYSHPVALNQCLKFFASHPELTKQTFYDTAGSVKMIMAEGRRDAGAIASAVAAEIYGARILKRSIEDDRENHTRFFLLRRPEFKVTPADGPYKTSLVMTVKNVPGSLFRALGALALRDISLSKIESRPRRGTPWEYLFYLDFAGHTDEPRVRNAIGHLEEMAGMLRVLGSYPAARR